MKITAVKYRLEVSKLLKENVHNAKKDNTKYTKHFDVRSLKKRNSMYRRKYIKTISFIIII